MEEFTLQELFDMYEDAVEAYESAVWSQRYNGEALDIISEIRGEMEGLEEEIARRKGEQG